MKDQILYEDNHLLIVNKKPYQLVQSDQTGDVSLLEALKEYIKVRDEKKGNVFLGLVHRIDRPVSGIVLFAKTSKALKRLNESFKNRLVEKKYWAITEKKNIIPNTAHLTHYLKKNQSLNKAFLSNENDKDAKKAELIYTVQRELERYYWLDVSLLTGRHHQIRAQLSFSGLSIQGDVKYGANRGNSDASISLHAYCLKIKHPVTAVLLDIFAIPYDNGIWPILKKMNLLKQIVN